MLVAGQSNSEIRDLRKSIFNGINATPDELLTFLKSNTGPRHGYSFGCYQRQAIKVSLVRGSSPSGASSPVVLGSPVALPAPVPAPDEDADLAENFTRQMNLGGDEEEVPRFVPQAEEEDLPRGGAGAEDKHEHRSPKGRRSFVPGAEAIPDLFETPTWAVQKIMSFLRVRALLAPEDIVWEPCNGGGRISSVLEQAGFPVIKTDLFFCEGDAKRSYLDWQPEAWDVMITNP